MKTLKNKIIEDLYATPENTTGMGQVSLPSIDNSTIGSDSIPIFKKKKQRKKYINNFKNERL